MISKCTCVPAYTYTLFFKYTVNNISYFQLLPSQTEGIIWMCRMCVRRGVLGSYFRILLVTSGLNPSAVKLTQRNTHMQTFLGGLFSLIVSHVQNCQITKKGSGLTSMGYLI